MKTDIDMRYFVELELYKDGRDNWRYNCGKLKYSGGYIPLKFAEELDKKYYGSKTDILLPTWLVSKLEKMKRKIHAISQESNNFTSGWSAAVRAIETASEEVPRVITRPTKVEAEAEERAKEEKVYTQEMLKRAQAAADKETKEINAKGQVLHITFPREISEEESEIYNGAIYETLKPNECYLITKKGDSILVVTNKDGKMEVKWVPLTGEDEPDIVSNTLTGEIESHDDNTSAPSDQKLDTSFIKHKIDNFRKNVLQHD